MATMASQTDVTLPEQQPSRRMRWVPRRRRAVPEAEEAPGTNGPDDGPDGPSHDDDPSRGGIEQSGDQAARFSERNLLAILLTVALAAIAMAVRLRLHALPSGDEPAYLVLSQTMQKYHSVDVMRDYLHGDYLTFYPGYLEPHVGLAPNHRMEPVHNIGGPLLWLIPFMLWGRIGAVAFIAMVSLLTVANLYPFLRERGIGTPYAFLTTLFVALASPVYVFSAMTFVEPIGALLVLYAVRVLLADRMDWRRVLVAGLALGYLGWVHSRFLMFTGILGAFFVWRLYREHGRTRLRPYLPLVLPVVVSLVLQEIYNLVEWGTLNPVSNVTNITSGMSNTPLQLGLPATMFDRQYGLITNFPLFLLVLPGLLLSMTRARLRLQAVLLSVMVPYLVLICTFGAWWAGYSPPARYIAVIVPLMAFYVAYALQRIHSIVLVCVALLIAIGTFALSLDANIFPFDRFAAPGHPNKAMVRLTHLFGGQRLLPHLPSAFTPGGEHMRFLAWSAATVALGVALWVVGRWRRDPYETAARGDGHGGGLMRPMWTAAGTGGSATQGRPQR